MIAPSNLLTLNNDPHHRQSNLNPRYFQPYRDQTEANAAIANMVDSNMRRPAPDTFDSEQRHLQEHIVRNYKRGESVVRSGGHLPLLRVGGNRNQFLYVSGNCKEGGGDSSSFRYSSSSSNNNNINQRVSPQPPIDYHSLRDYSATIIQSTYRSFQGKKEFLLQREEFNRRTRAALVVQCALRRRNGYSKFLLRR